MDHNELLVFGNHVKRIIGDYNNFFSDLLHRTEKRGIDIEGMPIVQLLYRTATLPEYESIRERLKPFCKEFVETLFNGRAVAILILKAPLELEKGFSVSVIELPAPRSVHMYPSGLESVGIFVDSQLPEFKHRYKEKLTGVKEHGKHCQPAFITFDNEKTIKFYDHTLEEIILLQGWRLEQLSLPAESPVNKMAELVNAWQWHLHSMNEWRDLIRGAQPRDTGHGLVYELPNPIERSNESFAVVDMRDVHGATQCHSHHLETEVYFVLEGWGHVVVDGKEEFVQKEATVIIPPNTAHFTIPHDNFVLGVVNTPPFRKENYKDG